jgi:hypothetical protein
VSKVIKKTMKKMRDCEFVAEVTRSDSAQQYSLIVQVSSEEDVHLERVLAVAKTALLEAAVPSKSIYIVGYCSPDPFTPIPSGFEATLGFMENATRACWHLFKKGSCRYGAGCSKQHPVGAMPVRVVLATTGQSATPSPFIHGLGDKVEF